MRLVALITISAFFAAHAPGAPAQVVVPERPSKDPAIDQHIKAIVAPKRSTLVEIKSPDGARSRRQRVSVTGPIADDAIIALLTFQVGSSKRFWGAPEEFEISVTGDEKFAQVDAVHRCPGWCGGASYNTYAYNDGKWALENSHTWVE